MWLLPSNSYGLPSIIMTKFSPEEYDAWYETPLGSLCDRLEKEAIFRLFKPKGRVLDAGCGTGNYTMELVKQGVQVVGMDSSVDMTLLAKRKSEKKGFKVNFVVGKGEAMPFRDNVFSGVLGITVLCFVSNPELVIAEVKRILKLGGEFTLGELNSLSYWALLRKIKALFKASVYRQAIFFSIKGLKETLQRAGFKDLRWSSCLYFPPVNVKWLLNMYKFFEAGGKKFFSKNGVFIAITGTK